MCVYLKICEVNFKFIQIYSYILVWYRTRGSFQRNPIESQIILRGKISINILTLKNTKISTESWNIEDNYVASYNISKRKLFVSSRENLEINGNKVLGTETTSTFRRRFGTEVRTGISCWSARIVFFSVRKERRRDRIYRFFFSLLANVCLYTHTHSILCM